MTAYHANDRVVTTGGRSGEVVAPVIGGPLPAYLVLLDGDKTVQRVEGWQLRPEPVFGFGAAVRDLISRRTGVITGYVRGRRFLVTLHGDGHPTVRRPADLEPA